AAQVGAPASSCSHATAQGPTTEIPHVGDSPQMRFSVCTLQLTPQGPGSELSAHAYAVGCAASNRSPNIVASGAVYSADSLAPAARDRGVAARKWDGHGRAQPVQRLEEARRHPPPLRRPGERRGLPPRREADRPFEPQAVRPLEALARGERAGHDVLEQLVPL